MLRIDDPPRNNRRPFQNVKQFPHISRPVIFHQPADRSGSDGFVADPSQKELDQEIRLFELGLQKVRSFLDESEEAQIMVPSGKYPTKYEMIQAMASHISYHMAEIVLLRRIFGAWPPRSGGMTW
jgi:hypothetical protein